MLSLRKCNIDVFTCDFCKRKHKPSCPTERIFLRLIVALIPATHDCVIMIHSMTPRVLEINAPHEEPSFALW